jgi:hypothetical protein
MTSYPPAEGPCTEWTGGRTSDGYGVKRDPRGTRIHRLAWMDVHGEIPSGMEVLHACDNPPCYRIEHLFLGTQADNIDDMVAKGRNNVGERNGRARLTEQAVRDLRAGKITPTEAAAMFDCTPTSARYAKRGASWKKLKV